MASQRRFRSGSNSEKLAWGGNQMAQLAHLYNWYSRGGIVLGNLVERGSRGREGEGGCEEVLARRVLKKKAAALNFVGMRRRADGRRAGVHWPLVSLCFWNEIGASWCADWRIGVKWFVAFVPAMWGGRLGGPSAGSARGGSRFCEARAGETPAPRGEKLGADICSAGGVGVAALGGEFCRGVDGGRLQRGGNCEAAGRRADDAAVKLDPKKTSREYEEARGGFTAADEAFRGPRQWMTLHMLLGSAAGLMAILVNSITITYFIGTSRWCKEVCDTYQIGASWPSGRRGSSGACSRGRSSAW